MERRTFFKSLFSTIFLPFVTGRPAEQEQPPEAPAYTDSDDNDPVTLAALYDGNRTSGVVYQP